jgi:hypothetical protein
MKNFFGWMRRIICFWWGIETENIKLRVSDVLFLSPFGLGSGCKGQINK